MTNIIYLANETVHDLLINLTKDDTVEFRKTIEQTLEDFSAGGERQYQPEPGATTRPNGQRILLRGFTSGSCVGAKLVVQPPARTDGRNDPIRGILVLLDGYGVPTALIGAEEVTGYRTSMNVMVPFSWRKNVDKVVIFGGGMQALWHTRLILALRGSEVRSITYIAPSKHRVDQLIETVSQENATRWKSQCTFKFACSTDINAKTEFYMLFDDVDCIFCTTPSRAPLFPAAFLTGKRENNRQPFVSAIGSWQQDMIELDPELLSYSLGAVGAYNPLTGEAKGVVLVDDRDFALENCGEIVQSRIRAAEMVELGEIIAHYSGKCKPLHNRHIDEMNLFMSEGFVVYKSIGVSLSDLTTANRILDLSRRKQK
ncbi:hypothetical protein K4F52_002096 [Lecanicillium sp. MT-2017a]|nr:hypothetical protein K4F52_002096 [Lecanicillium sp. MT-2017a]